jgi:hypothetical protein
MVCSFRDDYGAASEKIKRVRFGNSKIIGQTPDNLHGVPIPKLRIETELRGCIDPSFTIEILLPWNKGLDDYIALLAQEDEHYHVNQDPRVVVNELRQIMEGYLPPEPPPNWKFEISPDHGDLADGQVLAPQLSIEAPTIGRTAFALRVRSPEDEVLSNIALVAVDRDGARPALTIPDDVDEV